MICDAIQKLMDYGLQNNLIQPEDRYVVQNQYMEIFQLSDWQTSGEESSETEIDMILEASGICMGRIQGLKRTSCS